ncbi:zinc ABC transporter substrate-binding protein [Pseudodesulfovibrio sp.]|uniref:metal ABC transporter solute-binding protein, Zn/Mn family n=1 Tax=Pseudodesulfovibrio sp. TaxID=2035812 RepID=UPI00262DC417|nr:zinc ABC transporter substrate-binding protein [Pseudodesulfovibrio sp.]MDD3313718.1 zinc ABC transporter substrate-binding protein [Pseudodesulfovibrio sp.]
MRTNSFFRTVVLILGLVLFSAGSVSAAGRVPVFVSIVPQLYFLAKIGGDRVNVSVMVMPGASPATYEPTPRQMTGLAKAKAYFAVGVPFESTWLSRFESANPTMAVVRTDEGIEKMPMAAHHHHDEEEGHGPAGTPPPGPRHDDDHAAGGPGHGSMEHGRGDHDHGILDPHIWLSPRLVKVMARNIYKGLVEIDPAGRPEYTVNLNAFLEELDALDGELSSVLSALPPERRTFMVFHPSWGYFARDYGLRQIPIESEGKEPSPGELARIVETGKERHIPVVFVQPQFSERSAKVIASEMGAKVVPLNPLAPDWKMNLLKVAEAFRQALQ